MKGMSLKMNIIRISMIVILLILAGCSGDSTTPPVPSGKYTLTFDAAGASLDFANLNVQVDVPAEAVIPGETVPLQAQLMPDNLPTRGVAGSIHERIGWISLKNMGDPNITLQKELTVYLPLNGTFTPNVSYTVFRFDQSQGIWVSTGKAATVTDTGTNAIFNINSFGIWGVFKVVALHLDAKASRTTGLAPASITLTAIIDGGAPPYTVTWWFGDDKDPETGIAVGHLYEKPITYTATCIVIDDVGHEVSDTIDIDLH